MTLQQLKYIIEIAETGSITMAAQRLFIAQPSLSKSVAELEKEMGITIFNRSNRGVYLSEDGTKFLSYARQIVEQTELLENEYKSAPPPRSVFAVSSQHYAFVVNAFVELVREYGKDKYDFTLRELKTSEIIEDVRTHRSDIGILYLSNFNREVIHHILQSEEMQFVSLFTARPHVFVSKQNPLVGREKAETYVKTMTAQSNRKPFYEHSRDNVLNYWIPMFLFVGVFAILSVVFLEFVDKDKR